MSDEWAGPCPGQLYDDRQHLGYECDLKEGHAGPHGCGLRAAIAPDDYVYPGVPVRLTWAYATATSPLRSNVGDDEL